MADVRERIVAAAVELLTRGGQDAVSTRAVSAAAGVQAPAIYRQFGDMRELLHAAARAVFAGYVAQKSRHAPDADPLEELRRGWDLHVAFGLANPAAYALLYGESAGPIAQAEMKEGQAMLDARVARLAEAGQLKVSVEHGARMIHAGACGVTLSLIALPVGERDPRLSESMREAVLGALIGAPRAAVSSADRVASRAVALQAVLGESGDVLSAGERSLLDEWLKRLASAPPTETIAPSRARPRAKAGHRPSHG